MVQYSNLGSHFKSLAGLKMTVYFLSVLTFLQCKSGTGTFVAGEIDVSRSYPLKELYLQDVAKVEYIAFETNVNTIMRIRTDMIVYVSDNYIIVANTHSNDGDILVFDGKGRSKFTFNHRGQGPTNYNSLFGGIAFDEKAKEIFVFDRAANPKIQVYAENGEHKRTLTGFPDFREITLHNFDDETLLIYDNTGVWGQNTTYSHKPYMLMSKRDGSIVDTLNIHLPVRLSNAAVWRVEENGQPMTYSMNVPITNNRSFGNDFIITDWSSDTIYRLTPQRELQPMIVRKPPMQDTEPKILISNFLATDKFKLLGVYVMDYGLLRNGGDIIRRQLMYDFETGQINEYRFKNRDITSSRGTMFHEAVTPENTAVTVYDVVRLFEMDENGEIRGELKELLKTLDEEDNPVLMKITFK